ncbi:hypothetical protein [Erythrobacter sp. EC-HK427]|uniref:hypothetical protein n=1 Tax=Erythrobacter sp. EC-HK427 TaxID=2038396 RepID=UPI0012597884|nr:hypothetical protein [Erythrobacter sp. EC-HK427]VVT17539.1 conserved exported hypothetical protein [Erythrobacter sp. EC-HK427]
MKRIGVFLSGAALALTSSMALAGDPEDLLPPAFRNPPPQPAPTAAPAPTPTPRATVGGTPAATPVPSGGGVSAPSVPSAPQGASGEAGAPSGGGFRLPEGFPTLEELESMESDEINEVLGLRPRFDIPPAARREVERVGVLSSAEGGFPYGSLEGQPGRLVEASLRALDGPMVSRWGHILVRRALASRLNAPQGMNPVTFAAMRAQALGAMGEGAVARALVQDVDGNNYNRSLTDAAFDSYLATGDILGMCPVARLRSDLREDGDWEMLQGVCLAYVGEARSADRRLGRTLGDGEAAEIDVRLAQRYAGAAGEGGRAVNIEWDGVEELTPWRFALARALGVEIPESLLEDAPARLRLNDVLIPATPLDQRIGVADLAGARGILSSSAMVDLYSQLWASDAFEQGEKADAALLRDAFAAGGIAARIAAMRSLWGEDALYGRKVLTAYAAARIPVSEAYVDDASGLIASMLSAGLDRNALQWGSVVPEGSEAWAMLALAQPERSENVSTGAIDSFAGDDASADSRKTAFLVAGLAGLGRIDAQDFAAFGEDLGVDYTRDSAWSQAITRAAAVDNPALVALLAGVGMRGSSWEQMTPRHLYYIVSSLNRVGLSAEARMIAVEAVTRG